MTEAEELTGSVELLKAAIHHKEWPPRRWLTAHGAIDHLPWDCNGIVSALAAEYRTLRRCKQAQLDHH